MKNLTEDIGYMATIIGLVSYLPVVYNVAKTQKTNNFPFETLYFSIVSLILWIIYGIRKSALADIFRGTIFLLIFGYILFVKIKNKDKKK